MNQQPSMILTLKVVEAERLKIASSKTLAYVRFEGNSGHPIPHKKNRLVQFAISRPALSGFQTL